MHTILKNGQTVSIRPIKRQDAIERHAFFVALSLAQNGMVHTVDEIDYHVAESEEQINDFIKNQRGLWLIALNHKGEVVGEVDVLINPLKRVCHVGKLTIGILPSHQRLGLGSFLLTHAILWAKKHGLLRLELTVFAHNKAALELYKKHGFVQEGVKKNFLRHDNGSFEDDLLMAKSLF
jgi:ribosomal protein S18 acetylase RimI-like enzyme